MQRWTAIVFVGLVATAILVVALRAGRGNPSQGLAPALPNASPAGVTAPKPATLAGESSLGTPPAPPPAHLDDLDAGIDLGNLGLLDSSGEDAGGGRTLPDGKPAPNLPAGAPQAVTFGAVLVEYQGAQGAGTGSRTRDDAVVLAKQLAALAKTDFKTAVAQGDKGSSEDLGGMQRNILEPGPEFVLFSLSPNEVSEPVDSPRGFYIFKRIE